MPDFTSVITYQVPMAQFIQEWNPHPAQLSELSDASVDRFLTLLASATDGDVVFVPDDPAANDADAADPDQRHTAWTIAHTIVHTTATAEECAAVAAELARGVEFHGRPRYETPWQSVLTVEQCRQRLAESRRMRLASLQMWPDDPHLSTGYAPWPASGWVNAQGIFAWGLVHDEHHLAQIEGILGQIGHRRDSR